ncbi:MAG: hypothetical protein OEY35_00890 [Gammaproteobacteria bacterium]|nr:hypothetical protein [Gammaproteobacteria bacterium]
MNDRINELLERIRNTHTELLNEIQNKQQQFYYYIQKKKIRFEPGIKQQHRYLAKPLLRYILDANLLNILTFPFIWLCLFTAVLLDFIVTLYQMVCFPIYGIPKVKRSDYLIIDRQYLAYLNLVEKLNCVFCGYFNGLIAYVREIAARTEQHWCPIKHAHALKTMHDRYQYFIDYGDANTYCDSLDSVRNRFQDLH